jgi:hypothetical protein
MIFKTQNSTYEVDSESKKIRRLYGADDPTDRQGKDAEWRDFEKISPVVIGDPVLIIWEVNETGTALKATQTSLIKDIIDSKEDGKCLN